MARRPDRLRRGRVSASGSWSSGVAAAAASEPALLPLGTCASICVAPRRVPAGRPRRGRRAACWWLPRVAGFVLARRELSDAADARARGGRRASLVLRALLRPRGADAGTGAWYGYNFLNDTAVQFLLADQLKHHGVQLRAGRVLDAQRDRSASTWIRDTHWASTRRWRHSPRCSGPAWTSSTRATWRCSRSRPRSRSRASRVCAACATVARRGGRRRRACREPDLPLRAAGFDQGDGGVRVPRDRRDVRRSSCCVASARSEPRSPLGIAAAAMISVFSTAAGPYLVVLAVGARCVRRCSAARVRSATRLPAVVAVGRVDVGRGGAPDAALGAARSCGCPRPRSRPTRRRDERARPARSARSSVLQVAGVWLSEDYGLPIAGPIEIGAHQRCSAGWCSCSRVAGRAVFAAAPRPRPGAAAALGRCVTAAVVAPRASPYADAKLLALASPAVVFTALCGALSLAAVALAHRGARSRRGRGGRGAGVGGLRVPRRPARAGGAAAGARGRGRPRRRARDGSCSTRSRSSASTTAATRRNSTSAFEAITPRQARPFGGGYHLDLDQLDQAYVQSFDAIVTRRGPAPSRPPANYRRGLREPLVQRVGARTRASKVRAHLPVQEPLEAGGFAALRGRRARSAAARQPGDRLVAATRRPRSPSCPSSARRTGPLGWPPIAPPPGVVEPRTPGVVERRLPLRGGAYDVWVRASTGRRLTVSVDGRASGRSNGPQHAGAVAAGGLRPAGAGQHWLQLERPGGGLAPGDGVESVLGPVALVRREPRGSA